MKRTMQSGLSLPIRFALGSVIVLIGALLIFYWVMRPPMSDLGLMAGFLSITTLISIVAGYATYRMDWMLQSPAIGWTILAGYILSGLLTFLNVWLTARLMFASQHDLLLATILLVFASGIAMVFGVFFSSALVTRLSQLKNVIHQVADGQLDVEVPVSGKDEVADLAASLREMTAQLREAKQQQKELERLRNDLIAWVSHDLQTPLSSIQAIVEALVDGIAEDPDTVQRYLRTAKRDVASLSGLIDDLFQMAQMDAEGLKLDCEWNSLSDLVSDTLESFRETARQHEVALSGVVAEATDPVWMDARRIGRVLSNLINNALRYSPAGSSVEVRAWREADKILVEVHDQGAGILPADLPFVFDRFYRGEKSRNRNTGGAGLGLAIARGIVEAHHGQISVTSVPKQDTQFSFWLPAQKT